jgi:hypothetical protein
VKTGSPFFLVLCVTLLGCESQEEDLAGKLMQVSVSLEASDCAPERFAGDAGVQFFGERADGGVVFTVSLQGQFGPGLDGGTLASSARQIIPGSKVKTLVGEGAGCEGTFSDWERTGDRVFRITQKWPGGEDCPTGPTWLPAKACTTTRTFSFIELGPCQLRCVRIAPESGDVDCGGC